MANPILHSGISSSVESIYFPWLCRVTLFMIQYLRILMIIMHPNFSMTNVRESIPFHSKIKSSLEPVRPAFTIESVGLGNLDQWQWKQGWTYLACLGPSSFLELRPLSSNLHGGKNGCWEDSHNVILLVSKAWLCCFSGIQCELRTSFCLLKYFLYCKDSSCCYRIPFLTIAC